MVNMWWLLTGDLCSSRCVLLHRDGWRSLQHGAWLHLEQVIQVSNVEVAILFYDLTSEVTHHHIYRVLLVTQINLFTMWEGTTWGHKYQEVRITGDIRSLTITMRNIRIIKKSTTVMNFDLIITCSLKRTWQIIEEWWWCRIGNSI